MSQEEDYIWIDRQQMEECRDRIFKLQDALRPFAAFACDPTYHDEQGDAKCHNCVARDLLEE